MDGIYVFWYCSKHDDGAIAFYPLEDNVSADNVSADNVSADNVSANKLYDPPEWLNICYTCNTLLTNTTVLGNTKKELYCAYVHKGTIEYKNKELK